MASDQQAKLEAAFLLHQQGRLDEAAVIYQDLIAADPNHYEALHFLGTIRATRGGLDEARALIERSLSAPVLNIPFLENYAAVLFQIGDYQAAADACAKGLAINSANANLAYINAVSLYKLNRLADALAQFDAVLSVQPNHLAAINEKGSVLAQLKRYDAALICVDRALALNPQFAEAQLNKGNICFNLNRPKEALAAYEKALSLNPRLADAWLGLGNLYRTLGRHDGAFAAYDKALAINSDMAGAWLGRGNVLIELKRYDEAFAAFDRAFALNPGMEFVEGSRLQAKLIVCDWTDLEAEISHLIASVRAGAPACTPFTFLCVPALPADLLQCAKSYAPVPSPAIRRSDITPHDRIRLAYLSADFREHPVAFLTAGMFERHDKSRFETTAISLTAPEDTAVRRRLAEAFEHFIDAPGQSDQELAELIRRREIDILVDLMGYTLNNRRNVLARRVAPIQVNYLGYPATMGTDFMDYIIADRTVIPQEHFKYYSEKVVWLPDTFQVNDRQREIAEPTPTRRECGLPESGVVFCCFNSTHKILPEMFDVWMRLLRAVEGSVLWLGQGNSFAAANLRREAERRGVAPSRLIFAPRTQHLSDHLARHRQADVFLDTIPYNAHTTGSDALWAGVPIVVCPGETYCARGTASYLKALGLDELIAGSLKDYEALALKLAREPDALRALKDKLARNRDTFPLFDTERFTRHIEAAYATMWQHFQRGEPPSAFAVEPAA